METQLVHQCSGNVNLSVSRPLHMKAVDHKGHLGCIEILKAKAAIMFDRFCMNKAQQEVESQRKRGGGKGNNERISYSILLPLLFYS